MSDNPFPFAGLSDQEVIASRGAHGTNALAVSGTIGFWKALRTAITEPMIPALMSQLLDRGFSAENLTVGSGGGLTMRNCGPRWSKSTVGAVPVGTAT